MRNLEAVPQCAADDTWFKKRSLELLADQLAEHTYNGYPRSEERFFCEDPIKARELITEDGSWWTGKSLPDPSICKFHPWFDEMVTNKLIGAVAGLGTYYYLEENYTADPIVTRHDLGEPHFLLVTRKDTGTLAFPGGFLNQNEHPYITAFRECTEESKLPLHCLPYSSRKVYAGVLADLRVTAHSWPYTHAYHFKLENEMAQYLQVEPWQGDDDADKAGWYTLTEAQSNLHGSHLLLAELALRE